jgi:glycerol-3-phosphate dehydrogenase
MQNLFNDKDPDEIFDVLVIGGGITGCGIALDAQSRGMKTILVEMQDFASGTSSRSTKLIHGGLRYLKQLEFKIVAETGSERAIVYQNGLHVTSAQPMLLPIIQGGSLSKFSTNLALWVYDFLAGVKPAERRKMLSVSKTLEKEPLLRKDNLLGGAFYYEYRTDDARLTIEILKKAIELGAVAKNYTKVTSLIWKDRKVKRVAGVNVTHVLTGETSRIIAKYIVNAAGPWVDTIDTLNDAAHPAKIITTKGVHLVVDFKKLPLQQSVYFDVNDGRMMFAIPREGKTYIGTTDTFYEGDILHPAITEEDITYLLNAVNQVFPESQLQRHDIESGWAGVRPLIQQAGKKGASEISRKDEIFQYDTGLITIAGGKLTGYRKMAERVVNLIAKRFKDTEKKTFEPCKTAHLPVSGAVTGGLPAFEKFVQTETAKMVKNGWQENDAVLLLRKYGSNATTIFELAKTWKPETNMPQWLFGELVYALQFELVKKPGDFFTRRTGDTYFHIDKVKQYKNAVIDYMAEHFGWNEGLKNQYKTEFEEELNSILP